MGFLSDDDSRVREAAADTLVKLITRMFVSADWPGETLCLHELCL